MGAQRIYVLISFGIRPHHHKYTEQQGEINHEGAFFFSYVRGFLTFFFNLGIIERMSVLKISHENMGHKNIIQLFQKVY